MKLMLVREMGSAGGGEFLPGVLLAFREVPNAGEPGKGRVHGPKRRAELFRGCEDDTVDQRQLVGNAKLRSTERNPAVEYNNPALVKQRGDLQRLVFATLLQHSARHFHQYDRGHQ